MPPRKASEKRPPGNVPEVLRMGEDISTEKGRRLTDDGGSGPFEGECSANVCGPEAACNPQNGTHYSCICPHDSAQPTGNHPGTFKCPNRRVVDPNPRRFHNIRTDVMQTGTSVPTGSEPEKLDAITTPVIIGIALLMMGLSIVVILVVCWARRYQSSVCVSLKEKKRKPNQSATPMSLSKGLLDADRYTTNPQYFVAAPDITLPSLSDRMLPKESIQFQQIIGEGCFGKVYKGELLNDYGETETVAIKVLKDSASRETEEDFMREVEIMSSFQHSNIITLLGVTYKEPEKSPCMVFEFMPHGDLTEVLRSNSRHFWKPDSSAPRLTKESLLSIAIQIACGMQYLAGQHFVHRDLACRNCLVGANLTVKIADFGMSRDVYTCDYYKIGGSRLLPVRWMSPESVTYGRFTLESDVWSYGVVLWEIYSLGKQPYYGHSNEEVVKLILQGIMLIPPEDCPASICEIMETCWKTEPRDRATFSEIYDRLFLISMMSGVSHHLAVDCEDYLKPDPPKKPHEYMQPLPD